MVFAHVLRSDSVFLKLLSNETVHLLFSSLVIHIDLHGNLFRIPVRDQIIHPQIQRRCRGNQHQNRAGKNTDIRQAHGILLHAVDHSGYGDKMLRLIIILLISAQEFQYQNASNRKQPVRSQHHQNRRHEENRDGGHRIFGRDRQIISCRKTGKRHQSEKSLRLWLPLSDLPAAQQFNRVGQMNLPQRVEIAQQEDHAEQQRRPGTCRSGEAPFQRYPGAQEAHKDPEKQLREHNSRHEPGCQRCRRHIHAFQKHDHGNVFLLHAQDIKHAEFLFPALHQKAVGVEQKDHGEDCENSAASRQYGLDCLPAVDLKHMPVSRQRFHDIIHGDRQNTGNHIRQIPGSVICNIFSRHFKIKALSHEYHRPSSGS